MAAHCCSFQDLFNLDLHDPWDTYVYSVVHPALLQGDLLRHVPYLLGTGECEGDEEHLQARSCLYPRNTHVYPVVHPVLLQGDLLYQVL